MKRTLIKRIIVSAIIAFTLCYGTSLNAQTSSDTLQITLDDALKIALSENLTVQVADREVTKQEYAKKGTYASLYPQIDLNGTYQRAIKKQVMYMGGQSIEIGQDNSWSAGVSASMSLVSPTLWKSLKISGYSVELAVEKARSSRIDLIDQVKQAYYAVLLAYDSYGVYKEAYDNAVTNHADIKQKFEEGLSSEYDVIRANVNVKNAEPSMYDAENYIILTHWQLKAILGLDLESSIQCVGSLTDFESELQKDFFQSDKSLKDNSSLKQLELQIKQLEKSTEMKKAQNYPSLSAQYAYQINSYNDDFKFNKYKWDPYSYVGLSLSIPVFSGGKRGAEIKQSKVELTQLNIQRTDTERNLKVAVRQSNDQMSTSIKQYYSAMAGVEESQKGYEITMARYESGEGTLLDINDSQLSMTQAKLNLSTSIYNYLVAKSSLEKTLGHNMDEFINE